MKILIAGCGKVGETLTNALSLEGYDLTLIDRSSSTLSALLGKYDVIGVEGNCASLEILEEAGVDEADLLIACTGSDEVNLLCCMTAHGRNKNLHTIARISNPEYVDQSYKMQDAFGLSLTFNPDLQAATEIERLLRYPGFLKRDLFAKGKMELVELKLDEKSILNDRALRDISAIARCRVLVCAVLRNGVAHIPDGQFVLHEGDRVFVTASPDNLSLLLKNLGISTKKTHNVMIAGGGKITYYLIELLKNRPMQISVVEQNLERCERLAADFPNVTVIRGDVSNHDALAREGLSDCDALVTLTGNDELNLILSLYGNSLNLPQIITKVSHMENSRIIDNLPIGSIINPRKLCSNTVVRYVRAMEAKSGAAIAIHAIADGQVEASEFCVGQDTHHVGEPLRSFRLRPEIRIAAISHGSKTSIPNGDSCFYPGDHLVVVSTIGAEVRQLNDIFE